MVFMIFIDPKSNTWEVKMRPVEFIIKEGDEHLTNHSGVALIGALMDRTELGTRINCDTKFLMEVSHFH